MHNDVYLNYQSKEHYTFYLLNHHTQSVEGRLSFFIKDGVATTALKAPFGFFEMNSFKDQLVTIIILKAEIFFKNLGIERINIKLLPDFYAPNAIEIVRDSLKRLSFHPVETLSNYYIPVNNSPFEAKISSGQLSRLKKILNQGFQSDCVTHLRLQEVYDFIRKCRSERKYDGLVDITALKQIVKEFPEKYFLFVVENKNGSIAAANISVRVSDSILYTWYTHHLSFYNCYSPVILLHKCIYDFCREGNIDFIDLSVAKDGNGFEKISLQKFKKRIGGVDSIRREFSKKFE